MQLWQEYKKTEEGVSVITEFDDIFGEMVHSVDLPNNSFESNTYKASDYDHVTPVWTIPIKLSPSETYTICKTNTSLEVRPQ